MTIEELGNELRRIYDNAPRWEKGAKMVLFGIVHARELERHCHEVARKADVPSHCADKIAMGIQLAAYVTIDRFERAT